MPARGLTVSYFTAEVKLILGIILGLLILVITGCGSNLPARFYVLTPMNNPNPASVVVAGREMAIGVGPVELPMYLDRPQLMRRTAHNELQLSELENNGRSRWRTMFPPSWQKTFPVFWEPMKSISILGPVPLTLITRSHSSSAVSTGAPVVRQWSLPSWNIIDPTQRQIVLTRKFHYIDQIKPGDSLAAVKSKSHALERLSQDIAEELARLSSSTDREWVSLRVLH